jgi:hypothetical protein
LFCIGWTPGAVRYALLAEGGGPRQRVLSADEASADFARRANQTSVCAGRCQSPDAKIFLFYRNTNQLYIRNRPVPLEGRFAIVTSAGRDAVDAESASDEGI